MSSSVLIRALTILLAAVAGACTVVHKTIQSDNGDLIDCVDVHQQPALKHASPDRRQIQAKPERGMAANASAASTLKARQQTWRKHGSCPQGTVPILRASSRANPEVADLVLRASPFGRPGTGSSLDIPESMDTPTGKVEVAAAYSTNGPFLGAKADIPYWKVDVHPGEFSMSYLLVGCTLDTNYRPMPGSQPPADLTNQIAVALVAWPSRFGDSLLRLFVYYTTDGGAQKNCFNLDCGGFQLHQSSVALGDSWDDSDSQVGGVRYGITVSIHRGSSDTNWWVTVENEDIGYYPESVFNTRFPQAVYVEMGGRVLNTRPGGNHTTTPMGSGIPSCAGSRFAAAIMGYSGISYNGELFNDAAHRTITTSPSCYGANPAGFSRTRAGLQRCLRGTWRVIL